MMTRTFTKESNEWQIYYICIIINSIWSNSNNNEFHSNYQKNLTKVSNFNSVSPNKFIHSMKYVCLVTLACYGLIKYNFWQSHQVTAVHNIKIIGKTNCFRWNQRNESSVWMNEWIIIYFVQRKLPILDSNMIESCLADSLS